MKRKLFVQFLLLCFLVKAQVGIGTSNPRGVLDLNDLTTNTSPFGLVLPVTNDPSTLIDPSTGVATLVEGTVVYDDTEKCIKIFSDSEWNCLITNGNDNTLVTNLETRKCQNYTVSGNFVVGAYLRDQTISGKINIKNTGDSYIYTNTIDNASFSSRTYYPSSGINTFIIKGEGYFESTGSKTFTVTNDINSCEVDININDLPDLDQTQNLANNLYLTWGIDFDSNGDVFFTDELNGGGNLHKIILSDGTGTTSKVSDIIRGRGVTYYNEKIYISENSYGRVAIYDIATNSVDYLKLADDSIVSIPGTYYNRIDPISGNLYISSETNNRIYIYNFDTKNLGTLKNSTGNIVSLPNILGFDFDKEGNIYARSGSNIMVINRDGETNLLKNNSGSTISLVNIQGISLDAIGNIYVSTNVPGYKKVYKISSSINNGNPLALKNSSGSDLTFPNPRSIVFNSEGELYLAAGDGIIRIY